MQNDPIQTVKRLEALLIDTSSATPAELRQELAAGGVDVDAFLSRGRGVVRKGDQQQMRLQNEAVQQKATSALGSLFGDLSAMGGEQLRSLIAQVLGGGFGSVAQSAARCRNYQGADLS